MVLLTILLTILKTVGIVLLVILGILLLILLLILFVPVRYKVRGQKEGGDIEAHAQITWLLKFLNAMVNVRKPEDGELSTDVVIKIFFIKVFPRKEKKGRKVEPESSDPAPYKSAHAGAKEVSKPAALEESKAEGSSAQDFQSFDDDFFEEEGPDKAAGSSAGEAEDDSFGEPEKKGFFEKLRETKEKVCAIPGKVRDKWTEFRENTAEKKDFVSGKLDIINDPRIREALPVIIASVKKLLLHIAPKKGKVKLDLGCEDPSSTGKAVAVYSILSPYIAKWFILNAYFEEERLDVHGDIKGRIRIFSILRIVLGLWFNKKFKAAYKYIRSLE